jgi:hypothetical protein
MHEFLIALVFVGMVTCPALVASRLGAEDKEEAEALPGSQEILAPFEAHRESYLMETGILRNR